ncbi:cytochrome P450 [Micromonospora sp. NPDC049662]|uniref:cytochrome P450 n=1 Tax=Micromonospora sp. NPDC049662 TaxID=3155397 RepID=UPI003420905D
MPEGLSLEDAKASFGPRHSDLRIRPWQAYHRFRVEQPVAWIPHLNSYLAFSHAAVRSVLSSRAFTAAHHFRATRRSVGPTILDLEDPEHRRLRHLMQPAMGMSSVRANRPRLRTIVERLLDGLPTDQPVDLVSQVTEVLPMLVLCELLGLPSSHAAWLAATSRPIAAYLDEDGASLGNALVQRERLAAFIDDQFLAAADNNAPLGGALLSAYRQGELSRREAQNNVVMLFVVGTVTTICGAGAVLSCLLNQPDRYAQVAAGALATEAVVAESLRYQPPVHFLPRFVREETELAGVPLAPGTAVQVCLASANRDDSVFADPDSWLPGRAGMHRALSFGYGRHGCVGGLVGEAEIVELVKALTERFPSARAVSPVPEPAGWVLRRPAHLRVRLKPAAGHGPPAEVNANRPEEEKC